MSLCIPTFNGAQHLEAALDSANAQTFSDLEIVVSDSGSTDGTLDEIRSFQNRSRFPVRVLCPPPSGMVANWNHCLQHSAGRYVKFLFQDDLLEPDCISEMVALAEQDNRISLVFSPRHLLLDEEARRHPLCQAIEEQSSNLHLGWSNLRHTQSGRVMLADPALLTDPLNKIGEPTVVLLRRTAIERVGVFDASLGQVVDLEMWWRIMGTGLVGFVDKPLASFRIHPDQVSAGNDSPLKVTAELKRFAQLVLKQEFASDLSVVSRTSLQKMANVNMAVEFCRLQYRRVRELLGLSDRVSLRALFGRNVN